MKDTDLSCVSCRVTMYVTEGGSRHVYTDYDFLLPLDVSLKVALAYAELRAFELLECDPDTTIDSWCVSDVKVSFTKSHQSAEDPSCLP